VIQVVLEKAGFIPNLPMGKIKVSDCNIRKREPKRGLESLQESMESKGLLQPVTVIGPRDDGTYELIMGQRRFLAAKDLGWKEIPAIVIKGPVDEITKIEMSLSENIHSQEPFDSDILEAFRRLYKEKYHKVTEIQKEVGISTTAAYDYIWLLEAPEEIINLIRPERLPRGKAAEIVKAGYPDKKRMLDLAESYLSGRLTRDEKKRLIDLALVNRKASVLELEEEAKKPPMEYKITILLPRQHYERLGKAAEELGYDRSKKSELSDLTRIAVVEWLDGKGF
jgi:ParB family chromosome partitioning protein